MNKEVINEMQQVLAKGKSKFNFYDMGYYDATEHYLKQLIATEKDMLQVYQLYLKSLEMRREYGDKYGDTDELIEMYEKKLCLKRGKE